MVGDTLSRDPFVIRSMLLKLRFQVNSNPTLSASSQIAAKHAGSVSLLLFLSGSCY